MKKALLGLLVVLCCGLGAQGTVVVYDDFNDGVLDAGKWVNASAGGTVTEANGKLTVQAAGVYVYGKIESVASVTLAAGQTATLRSSDMAMNAWQSGHSWGLADSTWQNAVFVYTQDDQWLSMVIRKDGVSQTLMDIQDPRMIQYGWTLTWAADRVTVASDIWGTRFDSANPAKNGGMTWAIPGAGTTMKIFAEADFHTYSQWFDDMSLEVVPEPATLSLLGLAGLGILRKRH